MQSSTASTPPLATATPFAVFRDGRNPGWLEGHSFRHGEEVVNTSIGHQNVTQREGAAEPGSDTLREATLVLPFVGEDRFQRADSSPGSVLRDSV